MTTTVLASLSLLAVASTAQALTPSESASRTELTNAAKQAHKSGDHRKSLELYQKAAALELTPSLLYFIIWEEQELGMLAEAYAKAQQCLKELAKRPDTPNAKQLREGCGALEQQLKERVGRVVIDVPQFPEGMSIKLSGQQLNRADINIPYVITPGTILVEADAPGHSPFRLQIDVPEGKTVNVTVTMAPQQAAAAVAKDCPPGQSASRAGNCEPSSCELGMQRTTDGNHCCWPEQSWDPAVDRCTGSPRCPPGTHSIGEMCGRDSGPSEASPTASAPADRPTDTGEARPARRLSALAVAAAATGAAALVTAGIVRLVANGRFDDLKGACNGSVGCTPDYRRETIDGIKGLDNWSMGLAIGGAAAAVTGLVVQGVLWSRAGSASPETRVALDPVNGTLLVQGRF